MNTPIAFASKFGLNVPLLVLLAASGWVLPGTDAMAARPRTQAGQDTALPTWPAPPAEPRIRFVQQIAVAADWGAGRRWWERVADRLTGRRELGFVRPTGVAVSGGVLFVADPGAPCVVVLDSERGRELRVNRAGHRMLSSPVGVAKGPGGTVYVADSGLGEVLQYGRDGTLLATLNHPTMKRPSAVAVDEARGRIYVADARAHTIHVFDTNGTHSSMLGSIGTEPGRFNSPTHLALMPDGTLVVTDALNHRVQLISPEGVSRGTFGRVGDGAGDFAAPKGVAVDRAGHVYAADAMFDAIQVFDRTGNLLLVLGGQGAQVGQFWLPNGLYVDEHDRLFVADAYNRRIQVFQVLSPPVAGETTDRAGPTP
jgi:DNA-binding beta-propeller fold protein YncE